ncbi:MAG: LacI family DNA-binding transcriptional regulator [Armatimonadota bacterium]
MRRKGVSQGDVARLAGVSPTAVSIVLNGKQGLHRIAPETVERIHQAMAELRYRPHAVAQALAHGRTNTIGIVLGSADISYLTHPYFGPVLQGAVRTAFDKRRFVLLYHGNELGAKDLDATSFADGRCDGLILTAPFSSEGHSAPLLDLGFPFVTVGDSVQDPRFASVDIDNEDAARQLTQYLMGLGHQHILGLGWRDYTHSALQRLTSCRREVERAGGIYDEEILPRGDEPGTREVLCRYLGTHDQPEKNRPTALFCLTDDVAAEVTPVVRKLGFDVPQDLSIVGFDDAPIAAELSLTTVRQDPARVGEEAVRLLLRLIDAGRTNGMSEEKTKVTLPTQLIERGSAAKPHQQS